MTKMDEYIIKRWDLPTMRIKFKNLEKIISKVEIQHKISYYDMICVNHLDALYLAYYDLKYEHSKIKLENFGSYKKISYTIKNTNFYVPLYSSTNVYTSTNEIFI